MKKHLDIQGNKELNRIELRFHTTPDEHLSDYLERLGFRYNPKKPRLYFAPKHNAYKFFAEDLVKTLEENRNYTDIIIRPSHIPHLSNIIHNKFSYVTISYQRPKSIGKKNFVIFDQYKRIAEAIAQQYGEQVYKEKLVSVEAAPRMEKKKAKDLLEANQIIHPEETFKKEAAQPVLAKDSIPKDTDTSLTNSHGVYMEETAKDRYQRIEVPIAKTAKYEVTITLVQDENNQYRVGTSIQKNFGDHSSTSSPVNKSSKSYHTKKEALQIAFRQIITRIQSQIAAKDHILFDQDNNNRLLGKALKATVDFAKEFGITMEGTTVKKELTAKKGAIKTKKKNSSKKNKEKDIKGTVGNEVTIASEPITKSKNTQEEVKEKDHPEAIEVQEPIVVTTADSNITPGQQTQSIRKEFNARGFTLHYTGKQAFTKAIPLVGLNLRYGYNQVKLDEKTEKEFSKWIKILKKEIASLEGKKDKESLERKKHRLERVKVLKQESLALQNLVINEDKVFKEELFTEILKRVQQYGYTLEEDQLSDFRTFMMKALFKGTMVEVHPDMPIGKAVRILIDNYFPKKQEHIKEVYDFDYMDRVIAIMHDHYMEARRLSRKKVEEIKDLANVPNLGMLWEAVELSWLLWYKFYYQQSDTFENRLRAMIRFWNEVQPSYDYSDSSKELYKQYSTPCPIGAIIAEYTRVGSAARTFEPSAGNGLLVLGADPKKTHVNEIDKNRRNSLQKQGFHTITHFNAAEPFPEDLTKSFDVMVTNPPFATWDADDFDKKRIVQKYFNRYRRLDKNRLRLEHVMSGLALHTLKDSGKAALILMGHIYFDDKGFIAKARPFFNWLYMHYRVDDVINLNGFTLYNKQGATPKTMLVLISGRKRNPTNRAIAPTRKQAASLDVVVDTFEALWERVKSHIKTPLEILIQKLKIEIGDDIL